MNIQIKRGSRSLICIRDGVAALRENKSQMKTIGSAEVLERLAVAEERRL
jgi:hypothetical protein